MDSDHREIDVVEDDRGEGLMDPIEEDESTFDKQQRRTWAREERLRRKQKFHTR